jgi:hypothetical protein
MARKADLKLACENQSNPFRCYHPWGPDQSGSAALPRSLHLTIQHIPSGRTDGRSEGEEASGNTRDRTCGEEEKEAPPHRGPFICMAELALNVLRDRKSHIKIRLRTSRASDV